MSDELKEIVQHVATGSIFAAICGIAGYLHKQVTAKQKITLLEAFVRGFGSAVTGSLVMMACYAMQFDMLWTGVIVGTSGWLGADVSVVLVEKLIRRRLGL